MLNVKYVFFQVLDAKYFSGNTPVSGEAGGEEERAVMTNH